MIADFAEVLEKHCKPLQTHPRPWGWKEPRSIYLLPFLDSQFPNGKFLHMVRDGRDMALSPNQNQLRKHGRAVLSWRERLLHSTAESSMLLWADVNLRAADYGEASLRENYLPIRFEDLCSKPLETTARIVNFLEAPIDPAPIARTEITPPGSLGRWRTRSPQIVSKLETMAATSLRRFGYLE